MRPEEDTEEIKKRKKDFFENQIKYMVGNDSDQLVDDKFRLNDELRENQKIHLKKRDQLADVHNNPININV